MAPTDSKLSAASAPVACGPLAGIRVLELGGIGASPFGNMVLADMGADIIRVERPGKSAEGQAGVAPGPVLLRGRCAVVPVDLKRAEGRELILEAVRRADVLTEAFRPGVAERLRLGPDALLQVNPRLVYGRMTGWGREGPLAMSAGHDIDYIAVAGVLGALGRAGSPPPPPLALVGDMGGGGLVLALGILAALVERQSSGRGQVVDAAMVDGAALLMAAFWEHYAFGRWSTRRESNFTDGGAPYYDTYECSDGRYVAVGALEDDFYEELRARLGLPDDIDRLNPANWPELRRRMRAVFITRTRDEWAQLLEGADACVAPVLDFTDAPAHLQNRERGTFVEVDGIRQPAPAPRLSRTPLSARPAFRGAVDPAAAFRAWDVDEAVLAGALACGALC